MKINEYYSISDLALATTISLFYTIESIDKTNPKNATFVFRRKNDLDNLIEAFWKRELKVEPQAYFNQLRFIKSRLYEKG